MIICLCHRISDRDIEHAALSGVGCFEMLQDESRVASSCGSCLDCAREVFDSACGKRSMAMQAAASEVQ